MLESGKGCRFAHLCLQGRVGLYINYFFSAIPLKSSNRFLILCTLIVFWRCFFSQRRVLGGGGLDAETPFTHSTLTKVFSPRKSSEEGVERGEFVAERVWFSTENVMLVWN